MLDEFKKFAMRGNVVDLAVAVIIGAAFGAIVTSLVADIVMPIGAVLAGISCRTVSLHFNRMREACYGAAQGTGPARSGEAARSDGYKFAREDRGFPTADNKGELNRKRGNQRRSA